LAVSVLVCGLTGGTLAGAQTTPPMQSVVTAPLTGAAGDTVVASVVDTGVRTGASVTVTLRLVDSNGVVLGQVTGVVSASTPLRITARAPSSGGVHAQVLLPCGGPQLSAPVVTGERWGPTGISSGHVIEFIPTSDPLGGTHEPVTNECPATLAR
jgi:hypothetical protein